MPASATISKPSWREYLETEQAVRTIYLVFGVISIALLMWFLQIPDDGDLLRRLGRLLSHQVELAAVAKFFAWQMAAVVRLAAADGPQPARLRRSSFPVSPAADPVPVVL